MCGVMRPPGGGVAPSRPEQEHQRQRRLRQAPPLLSPSSPASSGPGRRDSDSDGDCDCGEFDFFVIHLRARPDRLEAFQKTNGPRLRGLLLRRSSSCKIDSSGEKEEAPATPCSQPAVVGLDRPAGAAGPPPADVEESAASYIRNDGGAGRITPGVTSWESFLLAPQASSPAKVPYCCPAGSYLWTRALFVDTTLIYGQDFYLRTRLLFTAFGAPAHGNREQRTNTKTN